MDVEELQEEVSELQFRVNELDEESRDFRDICNERGIQYEERLAAHLHQHSI